MNSSYQYTLRWRNLGPQIISIPDDVFRAFAADRDGHRIEILYTYPTEDGTQSTKAPLFFIHGGFGSAAVWIPWMQYFAKKGYACYACSLRGHGGSWQPGFWKMYWTPKRSLAEDARTAWVKARKMEAGRVATTDERSILPILVGNSSGGGLAQFMLSEGLLHAQALVLCASIPGTGSTGVYWNWFKLDQFFLIRNYLHLMHPRSPLSSTSLVHKAFFSAAFPDDEVRVFERDYMAPWESMLWPIGMLRQFVDYSAIIRNIVAPRAGRQAVCVVAGGEDKLMSVGQMTTLGNRFQRVLTRTSPRGQDDSRPIRAEGEGDATVQASAGVTLVVVKGSGHHLMNDLQTEVGAREVAKFIAQVGDQ